MELLEKYSYSVYTLGSFSAAAKELFISQPALSAAIARHEKNLGFAIFDRSVMPISLTPEGRIYVEYLEEKEKSENLMRTRIKTLYDSSYGMVSVGAYSYSATEILAKICGEFNKLFPSVKVRLDMGSIGHIKNLSEKMRIHALDMMISYDFNPQECVGVPLLSENMVVAMHRDLPGAKEIAHLSVSRDKILSWDIQDSDKIADLSVFDGIKFFEYAEFSNTRYKMNQIFGSYATANYTVENARQVGMHNRLMKQKIGAIITTDFHVSTVDFDDKNILYFVPKSDYLQRTLYIITSKSANLSPAAKSFLEVARKLQPFK
ncbi:MAG: LysR family transcriptional regulator [Ruminococcaceae bacterium]|nr:LysR family transcriptional regulator [Oscillospiraceae bacterium]